MNASNAIGTKGESGITQSPPAGEIRAGAPPDAERAPFERGVERRPQQRDRLVVRHAARRCRGRTGRGRARPPAVVGVSTSTASRRPSSPRCPAARRAGAAPGRGSSARPSAAAARPPPRPVRPPRRCGPARRSAPRLMRRQGFQAGLRIGTGVGVASSAASASAGRPSATSRRAIACCSSRPPSPRARAGQRRVGHLAGGGEVAAVEVAADLEGPGVRLADPGAAPHPVLVERQRSRHASASSSSPAPPAPEALPDAGRHGGEQRAAPWAWARARAQKSPRSSSASIRTSAATTQNSPLSTGQSRSPSSANRASATARSRSVAVDHRLPGERGGEHPGARARRRPARAGPPSARRPGPRPCM